MGMHAWFECKIRYEKVMENGMQKKVTSTNSLNTKKRWLLAWEERIRYLFLR